MRMVMTTGKTLMMAGMRGAISLDTTITILNQHIPGNGWLAVQTTVNNRTTDSQQLPTSSTAHARASPTVGVQVTDGSFFGLQVDIDIDKQIHVYGGGNGDDSNFYGVILSVGDGSRMKPVLIWYGGVYTSDSWNQPVTYNHIQFSTKIANVRRALFLCEQP
eukprot:CAMPEP_0116023414 /NCGR_PEP_ID=MMETSP0321-20121206/11583_1 /TAXON_ID=163516 /ORGANISM="Leptocylindrus danicus var. danicus, Strain B650" /LENGTH=161 /DNA_ID=CAMNT_0003494701 /DNA_START=525 /DNA_END=1007 /DNA_ORIENTATION=-